MIKPEHTILPFSITYVYYSSAILPRSHKMTAGSSVSVIQKSKHLLYSLHADLHDSILFKERTDKFRKLLVISSLCESW